MTARRRPSPASRSPTAPACFTKPKQTETTRRWKIAIEAPADSEPVRTKIEFSNRNGERRYRLEKVPGRIVEPLALRPPSVRHYIEDAPAEQKILVLADRSETQALRMNRPIVTTREAAARWQTEKRTTGKRLRAMEGAGLVRRLRHGLWTLDPNVEPFAVAPYLTAPFPAYVSFWSALSQHGMIEQIPRQISVASLDRTKRIATAIGPYAIHHLAPELFGGYNGSEKTGYLATPEKALFDTVYIRAATGSRAFFPELSLPRDFDYARVKEWTARITSPRLRTLVSRRLRDVLGGASHENAS